MIWQVLEATAQLVAGERTIRDFQSLCRDLLSGRETEAFLNDPAVRVDFIVLCIPRRGKTVSFVSSSIIDRSGRTIPSSPSLDPV